MQLIDKELLDLSPREFAIQIIESLKRDVGVDLRPILESDLSHHDIKKRAANVLLQALVSKSNDEGYSEEWQDTGQTVSDGIGSAAELLGTDAELEPNFSIIPSDLPTILKYRDGEVKDYVYTLTKRFENAAKGKTAGQAAIEIVAGGVIGVGLPAAKIAIATYRAGGATILQAAKAGITGIGLKTAIGVIVIALVGLLYFLLFENPKKVLGIVINDTQETFVVKDWRDGTDGTDSGDLYMEHGEMKSFMEDHEEGLSSPKIQVRQRVFFGEGDEENFSFAGIYFADRNIGLRGAEGIMVFTTSTKHSRIAHMFACPYVNDNGANMDVLNTGSAKDNFRRLYDGRSTFMSFTKDGYALQSAVNDPRGGIVACIAYVGEAPKLA